MHYTLHQLNIFNKICETKSITKAAEILHLTQPAVSIQLKNFQDQFEIPLTEIIGRQLYVTAFGLEIAEAGKRILEEVHSIKHKAMAHKGKLSGELKIAVVSTGKYVMPYFLSSFLEQHEGIDLNMDVTNRFEVIRSLEKNEVDFALVSVLPDNLQIESIELMENKLFLVGGRKRAEKLISESNINLPENLPFIFRELGSATRQAMERFLETEKIQPSKLMQLTSNEAVKQAVVARLGLSVMPIIGIKNELRSSEIKIIPVKGLPIITSWNLIWLKGKKFAPAASEYLKYLEQDKAEIIQEEFSWMKGY
ncbi:MAG: LysR family transcriptional regulator [Pedobacter sp.]|nr:LysR family transcriptional regulator [Pedobacter sp.]